jgi:hypothetical protein
MTTTARPASERQTSLITRLLGEKTLTDTNRASVEAALGRGLSTREASQMIDGLFTMPRKAQADAPKAEPGFYVAADGTPVKVQANKAGTGTYALTFSGRSWDYAPGLGRHFAGMQPMTAEEAARIGLASGRCIACCKVLGGDTLTAKVAAVVGYGEICASKHGWAFPKGAATQRAFLAENAPTVSAAMAQAEADREAAEACSPGQACDYANLHLCSKHSMQYQNQYGRAYNE